MSGIHECLLCGKREAWGPSWIWYGSLAMEDDHPEQIVKMCSAECQSKFRSMREPTAASLRRDMAKRRPAGEAPKDSP